MTDQSAAEPSQAKFKMSFREFLEGVHPSVQRGVRDLWYDFRYSSGTTVKRIQNPPIRLHCDECDGERWFRGDEVQLSKAPHTHYMQFTCSDCEKQIKIYSLLVTPADDTDGAGYVYKFGESPQFGVPVPNKVLKLFDGRMPRTSRRGAGARARGSVSLHSPTTGEWSKSTGTTSSTRSSRSVTR